MATRAPAPLLVALSVLLSVLVALIGGCRHSETAALVSGRPNPVLRTRLLETRPFYPDPPHASPDLLFVSTGGPQARREGGVPESLVVGGDCYVRAVWWATHLCGLKASGSAAWLPDKRMGFTTVHFEGAGRSDCPSLVTRFETVIEGLPRGTYRFGTDRKAVEFVISCADPH